SAASPLRAVARQPPSPVPVPALSSARAARAGCPIRRGMDAAPPPLTDGPQRPPRVPVPLLALRPGISSDDCGRSAAAGPLSPSIPLAILPSGLPDLALGLRAILPGIAPDLRIFSHFAVLLDVPPGQARRFWARSPWTGGWAWRAGGRIPALFIDLLR